MIPPYFILPKMTLLPLFPITAVEIPHNFPKQFHISPLFASILLELLL